jgi:hypothetical protein
MEKERIYYCWDEFCIFCENKGINMEHPNEWEKLWECWKSAIDANLDEKGYWLL